MTTVTTPRVPVPSGVESIRNVVLVGPSGAGKSRLFEHLVGSLAGSKAPRPNVVRLNSLVNHAVFGVGLWISALLLATVAR